MGCRILYDAKQDRACFYCSTTETAFGPVFREITVDSTIRANLGADEAAEIFLGWLADDPRKYTALELADEYVKWYRLVTTGEHAFQPKRADYLTQPVCRVCGEDEEMHVQPENVP